MFGFIKKMFFTAMTFFSFNPLNVIPLECVSMNNHECRARSEIIYVNTDESVLYPFSIKVNKHSGSSNNNNPYAKMRFWKY